MHQRQHQEAIGLSDGRMLCRQTPPGRRHSTSTHTAPAAGAGAKRVLDQRPHSPRRRNWQPTARYHPRQLRHHRQGAELQEERARPAAAKGAPTEGASDGVYRPAASPPPRFKDDERPATNTRKTGTRPAAATPAARPGARRRAAHQPELAQLGQQLQGAHRSRQSIPTRAGLPAPVRRLLGAHRRTATPRHADPARRQPGKLDEASRSGRADAQRNTSSGGTARSAAVQHRYRPLGREQGQLPPELRGSPTTPRRKRVKEGFRPPSYDGGEASALNKCLPDSRAHSRRVEHAACSETWSAGKKTNASPPQPPVLRGVPEVKRDLLGLADRLLVRTITDPRHMSGLPCYTAFGSRGAGAGVMPVGDGSNAGTAGTPYDLTLAVVNAAVQQSWQARWQSRPWRSCRATSRLRPALCHQTRQTAVVAQNHRAGVTTKMTIQGAVDVYRTNFGTIQLAPDRFCPAHQILLVNPESTFRDSFADRTQSSKTSMLKRAIIVRVVLYSKDAYARLHQRPMLQSST